MATKNGRHATVCIPWRTATGRKDSHQRVVDFWAHHGFGVVHGSSPNFLFNAAQARNDAVRHTHSEVVIVADADTIPDIAPVLEAIEDPWGVVWPFTNYRHIAPEWVRRADLMAAPVAQEYHGSPGGLFVLKRQLYWDLNGMDERFIGWGYEDTAFMAVAETLSTVTRLPGTVFSFDHPAIRDLSDRNPNKHRIQLYEFARGRPAVMRELIK
jgi:hypothetical protein